MRSPSTSWDSSRPPGVSPRGPEAGAAPAILLRASSTQMRFVFVDRVVSAEPRHHIETLKNVSATEDVFADHFPGYPVFPGALVVEAFGQASQLLIGMSHDFAEVGRLRRLSRVAFRRQIRPGDQLWIRCERRPGDGAWVLDASATVEGQRVATATLEYLLEATRPGADAARQARRLRARAHELQRAPDTAAQPGVNLATEGRLRQATEGRPRRATEGPPRGATGGRRRPPTGVSRE